MVRLALTVALASTLAAAAARPALAQQPAPKAPAPAGKATPPAVPRFELPPGEPGFRSPRELRVRGDRLLGTEVTVKGYITWIYDCAKQIARPKETPAQVQKRIYEDQTICERPKFYLGPTKDTPADRSIWVVEVPRPPTKREREVLPKDELAKWPAVPKFALGDHVAVTGTWELQTPRGDRNSDGLLIFKSIQPAKPAATPPAAAAPPAPPPPRVRPAPPQVPAAPKVAPIDPAKKRAAYDHTRAGAQAVVDRRYDDAIRSYKAALAIWPDDHGAWYGLTVAHARKLEWPAAAAAMERAARLEPRNAMYQQVHGMMLYEANIQRAREAEASRLSKKPDEVLINEGSINHEAALAKLALSAHLERSLWRTHFYLGRIYRARGDARAAAEAFDEAVRQGAPEAAPYIALVELYRRWEYLDEAIATARLGAAAVTDPGERGDVLYMLGVAHDEKREDTAAIEAFTKALAAKPSLAPARFMRAQVHLRRKDHAAAKADLEAYLADPGATQRTAAQKLLGDLARGKP